MLDMGFIGEVDRIVAEARWRRQTMLFSATLEGTGLVKFANEVLKDPEELNADSPRSERRKIQQLMYLADTPEHKFALLCNLLRSEEVTRSIIFVKTRERLAEISAQLQASGINCAWIRGEMEQEKRSEAIRRFRTEEVNVLVATDVAARGIDLPDVSHVINFDLPRTADVYIHRIGRTGRAGKRGTAVSLIEAHDMPMLARIERYTGEELRRRVIDELRPQHKTAKVGGKKKPDAKKELKRDKRKENVVEEPRKKERLRDKKNKGKPDWAKKKAAKEAKAAKSAPEGSDKA